MTVSPELLSAYHFHRAAGLARWQPVRHGLRSISTTLARAALANAREDVAAGRERYTSSPWRKPVGNGARFATHERDKPALQWIEKPADMGLRFVGYCDKLYSHIRHTGWYTDAFQNETIRGVVYQLPGRNGKARFVVGHDNPDNGSAENGGPACIDWSTIHESDFEGELRAAKRQIQAPYWTPAMNSAGYWAESAHESARIDAAKAADEFAHVEAERMIDYDRAWQAGAAYAETLESIAETKSELRALLAERRAAKAELRTLGYGHGVKGGTLCAAIERQAHALVDAIGGARDKASKLMEGDGGEYLSFWPGDATLKAAFNEGAGRDVLA